MSLQIILKNSSVSGKEPTASQLANGELALNYHADGPFISCKDSAGTVRRIAGVWISTTAPTSPQPGEFWLDTNTDPAKLKVYKDGTDTWIDTITVVAASTTAAGVVELATNAETQAGSDSNRAVTPASLQSKVSDSTTTTSSTTIASSTAVKSAKDVADAALPAAGGTISGNLTVSGDLTVNGTTTTIDTTTLIVEDKNIEMGAVGTPTDVTADGGGITLKGATDKTLNWVDSTDSWTSSENVDLASGKTYKINGTDVLSGTTLGSGVTGSSLTSVGTITSGTWNGTALTADAIGADAINGSKIADDSIDSEHYVDGSIDNVHVSASAAIAGTKIDPDFGAQDLTVDTNVLHVDATNNRVGVGTATPSELLHCVVTGDSDGALFERGDASGALRIQLQSGDGSSAALRVDDGGDNLGFYVPATSGTADVTIDSSGRLGVGTATPGADLEVRPSSGASSVSIRSSSDNASLSIRSGISSQSLIYLGDQDDSDVGSITYDHTSNYLNFRVNASDALRIDSSGNVGVGTTSPTRDFDLVRTTADATMRVESTNIGGDGRLELVGDNTGVSQIRFGDQDVVNVGLITYAHTNDSLAFSTNSSEALRIDSSGRLGLGTNSPSSYTSGDDFVIANSTGNGQMTIAGADAANPTIQFRRVSEPGTTRGYIQYDNTDDWLRFATNGGEAVRIDSEGNVGIGVTSAGGKVHIAHTSGLPVTSGTTQTNGALRFGAGGTNCVLDIGNAGASGAWLQASNQTSLIPGNSFPLLLNPNGGNVGIGSTDPTRLLTVQSTGNANFCIKSSTTGTSQCMFGDTDSDVSGNIAYNHSNDSMAFEVNGSTRSTIDSSGHLLVGPTSSIIGSTNAKIQIASGSGGYVICGRDDTAVASGNAIGGMRFYGNDADGNYDECARIEVQADASHANDSKPSRLVFSTTPSGSPDTQERMRITGSGAFFHLTTTGTINTTNYGFAVTSTNFNIAKDRGAANSVLNVYGNAGQFRVMGDGDCENTNNRYAAISDIKLKENVVNAGSQWDDIKALQVRNYNFKEETGYSTHTQIGLVAQEAELVCPGLVKNTITDDDTGETTKSVAYSVLYMKAVKALQEAMERIETLEAKVAALEGN